MFKKEKTRYVEVVRHYAVNDFNCNDICFDIDIFINDELIKTLNNYDEDSEERIKGFIEALTLTYQHVEVEYKNITDRISL